MSLAQDLICETVKKYVGCSLTNRKEELAELVSCGLGQKEGLRVVGLMTNCGTFTRGILKKIGVVHQRLDNPYVIGKAIEDVIEIAKCYGALKKFKVGDPIKRGSILHYYTPGTNDNHLECCSLEDPKNGSVGQYYVEHVGAGRHSNAVTLVKSDISYNWRRPLQEIIDVDLLLEPK